MKIQNLWIGAFSLALMLPFCNAQTANGASSISDLSTLIGTTHAITTTGPALTLDQVERTALAENPEIALAARKVVAAEAHVPLAGALDDPQAMYRGWQVPLTQPL